MIRLAHFKGYRVVNGGVLNANGKPRKTRIRTRLRNGSAYSVEQFTVSDTEGNSFPIPVHRLLAFQKFGEASLAEDIQVRHKNNNSLDNVEANILIGTGTDNALDRTPLSRQEHAAKGRQTYTVEFIAGLRAAHQAGESYREIEQRTGVSRSMLSYYLSKKAKRTSFTYGKPKTKGYQ